MLLCPPGESIIRKRKSELEHDLVDQTTQQSSLVCGMSGFPRPRLESISLSLCLAVLEWKFCCTAPLLLVACFCSLVFPFCVRVCVLPLTCVCWVWVSTTTSRRFIRRKLLQPFRTYQPGALFELNRRISIHRPSCLCLVRLEAG